MGRRRSTRAAAALVAGMALAGGGTLSASAATTTTASSSTLTQIKSNADGAVKARVESLNTAIGTVQSTSFMGSDQSTLVTAMQNDINGLQQLDQKIQSDTTVAEARSDSLKIFTGYRVYALELPVVYMVRATDAIDNVVVPRFNALASAFQNLIDQEHATSLQPKLDDLRAKVAAAGSAIAGFQSRLEGLTPADWNADHHVLLPYRTGLETARTDLKAARADAQALVAGLVKS